jgi:hypothetical protein
MISSTNISFTDPEESVSSSTGEAIDLLQLEQESWDTDTGLVTRANMVRFVYSMFQALSGTSKHVIYPTTTSCGKDGDDLVTKIYAYPSSENLVFTLSATHGDLDFQSIEPLEKTQTLAFQGTSEETLSYPCHSIVSREVVGTAYDVEGNTVALSPTNISIEDTLVSLPTEVYAVVKVVYQTSRYVYKLTIPKRDSEENQYASTVYGYYTGGVTWLVVTEPNNIDSSSDSTCGFNLRFLPSEPDPVPLPTGTTNLVDTVDYCTQEITSTKLEE